MLGHREVKHRGAGDTPGSQAHTGGHRDTQGRLRHTGRDWDPLKNLIRERNCRQSPQISAPGWGAALPKARAAGGAVVGSPLPPSAPFWGAGGLLAAPFPPSLRVLPPFLSLSCNLSFCCEQETRAAVKRGGPTAFHSVIETIAAPGRGGRAGGGLQNQSLGGKDGTHDAAGPAPPRPPRAGRAGCPGGAGGGSPRSRGWRRLRRCCGVRR